MLSPPQAAYMMEPQMSRPSLSVNFPWSYVLARERNENVRFTVDKSSAAPLDNWRALAHPTLVPHLVFVFSLWFRAAFARFFADWG